MVDEMLTSLNIEHRETKFDKPPRNTYAVWMDDIVSDGADDVNLQWTHQITIELYTYTIKASAEAETKIEQYLDSRGIRYNKQARFWIQDEQLYQTIYDFDYTTKTKG